MYNKEVLNFSLGNSVIIVRPDDTEVRVDDSTYLNCSISDASATASWYHYPVGKTSQSIVFFRDRVLEPYDKRFRVEMDSSTESFNLVISKANLEDAGKYVCQDDESGDSEAAQVIVLGRNKEHISTVIFEFVQLQQIIKLRQ